MRKGHWKRLFLLITLFVVLPGSVFADSAFSVGGLFSWDQPKDIQEAEQMFSLMERHGLTELYQYFSLKTSDEEVEDFLALAALRGIRVYLLAGSAEWALESKGNSLRKVIRKAADWNEGLPEDAGFAGVMADVEPYLLDEWKDARREALMQTYVQGFAFAYSYSGKKGLELLACIPFFYDQKDCEEILERLVDEGCDGLAVMNYLRIDEIEHIRTEAELAQTYGKRIINVYELQRPGTAGLTNWHTYYNVGLDALNESIAAMQEAYSPQCIDYALHYYPLLLEIDRRNSTAQ